MAFSALPQQKQTWLWLAAAVLLGYLVWALGPVLSPFVGAAILAYMLTPAVDWLDRRQLGKWSLPRTVAVGIVLALVVAVILGIVLVVVPVLQREIGLLRSAVPSLLAKLDALLAPRLASLGLDISLDFASLQKLASEQMADSGEQILGALLASAKAGGTALLGILGTFVVVPVVMFYLMLDWPTLVARAAELVPRRWATKAAELAGEADALLSQYLRGQLSVMVSLAVYYSLGLWAVGLDVALPVGLITGMLSFIPYVGFGLGMVLALLAGLLQFETLQGVLLVGLVYGIGQGLESFILTPRLVGERIGLSPLVVIFALMAFGQLFGFVGVLLALPATAVLSVLVKHLRLAYLGSSFYNAP